MANCVWIHKDGKWHNLSQRLFLKSQLGPKATEVKDEVVGKVMRNFTEELLNREPPFINHTAPSYLLELDP